MSGPAITLPARPRAFALRPATAALLVIDMQHEFLSPGGWIDALGIDVAPLAPAAARVAEALASARAAGLPVIHTREGYDESLAACPEWKRARAVPPPGAMGARGRYMLRGEPGHAIVEGCAPWPGEAVIDKPGSGAFHATGLEALLRTRGITQLVVCGVTLDCCVLATLFEASDRNLECLLLGDATGTYDAATQAALLAMLEQGVIASVARTGDFRRGLA